MQLASQQLVEGAQPTPLIQSHDVCEFYKWEYNFADVSMIWLTMSSVNFFYEQDLL